MGRTACTEPQCLYSIAIPLLPPMGRTACTRVHFTFLPLHFYRFSKKKISQLTNFMEIRSVGVEFLYADRDMTKPVFGFRNFANAPR